VDVDVPRADGESDSGSAEAFGEGETEGDGTGSGEGETASRSARMASKREVIRASMDFCGDCGQRSSMSGSAQRPRCDRSI
jgi:hypothetical protein